MLEVTWVSILLHFTRFQNENILTLSYRLKKEVLPLIHSLCQDVNYEVRACICSQLHYVARSLDAETVKPALLPSLVELASDEESCVRLEAVETIVNMLPNLQAGW
jgi:serine/threonine-protein phosphatase 4 regulatory subunit 4